MGAAGTVGGMGELTAVERTLGWALHRLNAALGPLAVSSLYRTRAVLSVPSSLPPIRQPDYLNAAAAGWTHLPADAVLALGKRLELASGRTLGRRDAPRPLDIDLLLYGDQVLDEPELRVPHPRLAERRFVLQPLADVAPDRIVPPYGLTVRELLARAIALETEEERGRGGSAGPGSGADSGILEVGWSGGRPPAP